MNKAFGAVLVVLAAMLVVLLLVAEFVLPNYVSRLGRQLAKDLSVISGDAEATPRIPAEAVRSNEFAFVFHPVPGAETTKVAGVIGPDATGGFLVVEQTDTSFAGGDLLPLLESRGMKIPADPHGGIRQLMEIDGALIGLFGLARDNCIFAALIDLDRLEFVDEFPCMDTSQGYIGLNNMGGGYAVQDDFLLMALGTGSDVAWSAQGTTSQDPQSPYGKVLRYDIVRSGQGVTLANRRIYSSGVRNPQGFAMIDGLVLEVEHGPMGGDEINLIQEDANYGWPLYSAGSQYNQGDLNSFAPPDSSFSNPMATFVPSIAPSDISECPSLIANRYDTADCVIVSALRGQSIFIVLGDFAQERIWSVERIELGIRLREVFVHDDTLYLVPDDAQVLRTEIHALACNRDFPCGRE